MPIKLMSQDDHHYHQKMLKSIILLMATQKEILGAVVVFKYFMTYQIPHVAKKELEAEPNCMLFFSRVQNKSENSRIGIKLKLHS